MYQDNPISVGMVYMKTAKARAPADEQNVSAKKCRRGDPSLAGEEAIGPDLHAPVMETSTTDIANAPKNGPRKSLCT